MARNQFRIDVENYLAATKGNFAESTYKEKRRKLLQYSDIMYALYRDGRIKSCAAKNLTADDIETYVTFRRSQGIKDSTICKDLGFLGDLLDYVKNSEMHVYKAVAGRKKPKSYNGKLDPLPDEIIERVYALARETENWAVLEGCVAVILGCAAGCRPQESKLLELSALHHLDPEPHIHITHVKGENKWGRPRDAPLNDGVSDIIEKYLTMRQAKLDRLGRTSNAVFPPLTGNKEFVSQQSMSRFKMTVARVLGEDFVLKDGRRSYGQRMLDRGVPIEFVSICMGHDSVETTQKYYANYRSRKVLHAVCSQLSDTRVTSL
jgi:site-specific recombinase XerD